LAGTAVAGSAIGGPERRHRRHVDDVVRILAKGADVGRLRERDCHVRLAAVVLGVDGVDGLRQRQLGVGQIEPQVPCKGQRQLVLGALGADRRQFGELEDIARERCLVRDPHPHGRDAALRLEREPRLRVALRLLGAPRQVLDDLARQARRLAGPALRQEIDEQPLACGHGADFELLLKRKAHRAAVRIAPRGAEIPARARGDAIDRDVHGCLNCTISAPLETRTSASISASRRTTRRP
jgi:hypothetical protein